MKLPAFRNTTILALLCTLVLLLPRAVAGAEPQAGAALRPVGDARTVQLTSVTVDAALQCTDEQCQIAVEQLYRLTNSSRSDTATIRMNLSRIGSTDLAVTAAFDPAATETDGETWELILPAAGAATATVAYTVPMTSQELAYWEWNPGLLMAWGAPASLRITLSLPAAIPDDAFFMREPAGYDFTGSRIEWTYEGVLPADVHRTWFLTPGTWAQQMELAAGSDPIALATLLMDLRAEAARVGAPLPDPYPRAVGALLDALAAHPTSARYVALADLYLLRASEEDSDNYRMLAVQALESAQSLGSRDPEVASRLAEVYAALAESARASGDPADALRYRELAAQYSGTAGGSDSEGDTLMLAWAVDMAEQGQTTRALVEAANALSPRVQDSLYRYAPPVRSARTDIVLTEASRTAEYHLLLYPPTAQAAFDRLEQLLGSLNSVPGCTAQIETVSDEPPEALLAVSLQFASPEDRIARYAQIVAIAGEEPDYLAALVVSPWFASALDMEVARTPWFDGYAFSEAVDLSLVRKVRDEQLQYTEWRLLEIAGATPTDETARLEQQLAGLALRDERQVWENVAASTYWTYSVQFAEPSSLPELSWLVGWGQDRTLSLTHRAYHWEAIAQSALVILGLLAILIALWRLIRRSTRRV